LLPGRRLLQAPLGDLMVQGVFQGVLIGAVSIFIYTRAVALLGPATVALITATVPGLTTLAAMALLGETPTGAALTGVGL
ncbi:EamA family transporter, partial [Acinetobacter baumannii]